MTLFGTALFSQRSIPAWLVLVAGLLLTALLSMGLAEQRARSADRQFELHVKELVAEIEKRLLDHEQILLGGAGLFDVNGLVTRAQWRTYVDRLSLQERYPGIQGVGFSQAILPDALAAHIAAMRAEGFSEYTVRPGGNRALYTSIIYLEPFMGRNLAAFGYDMHSEPVRRQAMQLAVNNNMTAISGKVRLVQETHGKEQAGFLMYVPVYNRAMPLASAEDRWQALRGFVYSPYRVEDLMQGILGGRDLVVDFTLHNGDSTQTDSLMYDSATDRAQEYETQPSHLSNRRIDAFGQAWTLSLRSRPAFQAQFTSSLDWLIPTLGAGFSLSLFALVGSLLGRRERALALADEMSARRAESEKRFHQLFLHMGQGVVIHQSDGRVADANPAAERILGLSLAQMQEVDSPGPRWQTIHEDGSDFPLDEHPARVALREGHAVNDVVMGIWHPATAGWRWIKIDAYSRNEGSSNAEQGIYAVFSDITEQRAADMAVRQTRKFLSDVLAAASEVAIIATDRDGLVTIFNKGAERLLGYSAGEMVGKLTPAVLHVQDEVMARAAELSTEFGRPIEGFRVFVEKPERDGSETREWTYVHKAGRHIPVSLVVTTMRDDSGEITGYLGIAEDIAERKLAQQTLNQFKGTLDRTLDCVFMFDAGTLRFFYANEGALKQVGYSREELLAMHPYDIKPDVTEAQFHELVAPLRAGEQASLTFETVHQHKCGKRVPVEIFLQYMAPAGEPARFVAIVRDMSERKAAEQELRESEQRFRGMLETSPIAARIARAGGHDVIFSNRRYAELINAAPGQASGVDPSAYYAHPEDYYDILLRLGKGEQIFDKLVELTIPGAGTKWALASYLPIHYQGADAVLGWFYDITDRKRAETALAEQALHTQAVLDNMVDGIITIDGAGIIGSFNPAAERIFGYTADETLGRNVSMLMPNPHRDGHDGYLRNYQATGVARIIGIGREVEGQRRDGSLFPMDLAISEVTRQGQPLYVGMVRDITERKRMDRMKSEFISTVSHELRTPLTSISGALGLVAGGALGELPEQAKQMIAIAHKNSQRLTLLINDLLDMEKIAAGKLHFEMRPQPLMPLIGQALEANRPYGAERRVALVLMGEAAVAEVQVDSQRLMQVLANLLSNAIKFSPEGGTVEVTVQVIAGKARVAVADHGPGIPASFRASIFQKFSQADASDTRQKGGTGLGLAITRELVERMDGQIGFDSVEGDGATFWFDLPLWHAAAAGSAPVGNVDAPRILVVEDEPDVAQLLGLMLTRAGYQVDIADTGAEALRALQQTPYAAVSLDLMLPDISGLEIICQVRQRPETADLPIVVVSARMEEGRLAINGDFSGIDWLAKPIDENHLLSVVERLVSTVSELHPRVLHVEDDADLHEVIRAMVGGRFDFELATTLGEARARVMLERFDVVILDLNLPDGSGWDLLPDIRQRQPDARVVILSGTDMSADEARKVEAVLLKSQVSPRELIDALSTRIQSSRPKGSDR